MPETNTETSFTPMYTTEQRIPPIQGRKGTTFVVFSLVHTLTDCILQLLRSNPDILMHGHLFNEIETQPFRVSDLGSWTMDLRDEAPLNFLRHMFGSSNKLVGFLSRPEDWRNRQDVLQEIVKDPTIKKVVITDDPLRSFAVYCKKRERSELLYPRTMISPQRIQQFIDGIKKDEQYYRHLLGSSQVLWINHQQFISDVQLTSMKLFQHLGVSPVASPSRRILELSEVEGGFCPLTFLKHRTSKEGYDLIRYSFNLKEVPNDEEPSLSCSSIETNEPERPLIIKKNPKWALLVPIRSTSGFYEWDRLATFFQTLTDSLPAESRERLFVHFGIDEDDVLKTMLSVMVYDMAKGIKCPKTILNEEKGHLCKIWNKLASVAVKDGCDFFVLLGDDITFEGYDWMTSIERTFAQVSAKTKLRHGVACVAFNDLAFPNFPTFPVLHRSHFDIFGELFSSCFINQDGDPYLFELYNRLGAAVFDNSAKIRNHVGGLSKSRYEKRSIRFKNAILSRSLEVLRNGFGNESVLPSLDVVVPTYRLNFGVLDRVLSLRVSRPCRVKFWIVVDNPEHPRLSKVQGRYDGKGEDGNYTVQILVHPKNCGASAARNTGMMRSCADWIVFFDDDVFPEENILDQYLAATFRHPDADAFAGVTRLPEAVLWWQKALEVSGVTYFYQIASRMNHVPWSVTANLCVKGRTNEGVMFRLDYPKSGGGEDVDFCFRLKKNASGIVAVPNAVAHHTWFGKSGFEAVLHVMKWVTGDSRCVEVLPGHTYSVFPGWTEFILFASLPAIVCGIFLKLNFLVLFLEVGFKSIAFMMEASTDTLKCEVTPVSAFLASLILMAQEAIRTACHVRRRSPRALCRRLDWFDGMNPKATSLSKRQHAFKFCIYFALFCYLVAM